LFEEFKALTFKRGLIPKIRRFRQQARAAGFDLGLRLRTFGGDLFPPMGQGNNDRDEQEQSEEKREGHTLAIELNRSRGNRMPIDPEKADCGVRNREDRESCTEQTNSGFMAASRPREGI